MSIAAENDLVDYCRNVACSAKAAAAQLALARGEQKNAWLRESAARLREGTAHILEANAEDIAAAPGYGLSDAAIDRLRLNPKRIAEIAVGLEQVAALPDQVGEGTQLSCRHNGLHIHKTGCP